MKKIQFKAGRIPNSFNILPILRVYSGGHWEISWACEIGWLCWAAGFRVFYNRKFCGNCDAFCECSLGGACAANADDKACQYFDDTSLNQLRQLKK